MIINDRDIIGIDYGEKRIGIARIHPSVRIAEPLGVVDATSGNMFQQIENYIKKYEAVAVVIGLPRGLDGQETNQTAICRSFAAKAKKELSADVYVIDEAGTSSAAKESLGLKPSAKTDVDALAAGIILEDFINQKDVSVLKV